MVMLAFAASAADLGIGGAERVAAAAARGDRRSLPPLVRTVSTRTDGPSLNGALARTGRLLAVFSLLLSAGLLLS